MFMSVFEKHWLLVLMSVWKTWQWKRDNKQIFYVQYAGNLAVFG